MLYISKSSHESNIKENKALFLRLSFFLSPLGHVSIFSEVADLVWKSLLF